MLQIVPMCENHSLFFSLFLSRSFQVKLSFASFASIDKKSFASSINKKAMQPLNEVPEVVNFRSSLETFDRMLKDLPHAKFQAIPSFQNFFLRSVDQPERLCEQVYTLKNCNSYFRNSQKRRQTNTDTGIDRILS